MTRAPTASSVRTPLVLRAAICAKTRKRLRPPARPSPTVRHSRTQATTNWLTRRCFAGKLFVACAEHDAATMLPLLPAAREHLNELGPEGDTLLHIASLYGYADLVDALLAAGSDPQVKDENKSTPLVRRLERGCEYVQRSRSHVAYPRSTTRALAATSTSCASCWRCARSWFAKWTTMRSWLW